VLEANADPYKYDMNLHACFGNFVSRNGFLLQFKQMNCLNCCIALNTQVGVSRLPKQM